MVWSLSTGPLISLAVSATPARLGFGGGMRTTTVGFSGVLFSLKVVANESPSQRTVLPFIGVTVPSRWATWVELLLIKLLVPSTSFVGHLAGILSGLAWLHLLKAGGGGQGRQRQAPGGSPHSWASSSRTGRALMSQVWWLCRQLRVQARGGLAMVVRHVRWLLGFAQPRQRSPRFRGSGRSGYRTDRPVDVS